MHSLVPEPLQGVESVAEFMEELPKYDGDMAAQLKEADEAGECLRFVGEFLAGSPFIIVASLESLCLVTVLI